MNQNSTVEKMRAMRMRTMANLYDQTITENLYGDLTTDDYMAMLIDCEWEDRQHKRIETLIRTAGFKTNVSAQNIDYLSNRNLDKNVAQRLLTLNFLKHKENIIITGPTGLGKSYLAQAIGNQACQMLFRTRYFITSRFFDQAKLARLEGSYLKFIGQLYKSNLIILDDFGLHAMEQADRQVLLDLIEDCYQKTSMIICSQIPVSSWHDLIGEGTIADAILDRVVYSSHRIELKGESLRRKQKLNN